MGRGNADAKALGHEPVWHTAGTMEERQQELGVDNKKEGGQGTRERAEGKETLITPVQ